MVSEFTCSVYISPFGSLSIGYASTCVPAQQRIKVCGQRSSEFKPGERFCTTDLFNQISPRMFRLSFSLKSFGFSISVDFLPSLYINNSSTKREVKSELLITIQQLRKCGPLVTMGAFLITQLVKKSTCNAGDPGSIPGSRGYPGEGNGNPFQYSCLENPMDRGAGCTTVHGVERVGHNLVTRAQGTITWAGAL